MHPDSAFRSDDRALMAQMVAQVDFGMIVATTPAGPRVAHVPLLLTDKGAMQFHLSRRNALTPHLDDAVALAVVNGPDAYVSPRWYGQDPTQVPTWNYVSVELEGPVRRMDEQELHRLLGGLSAAQEARLPPPAWTMDKMEPQALRKLMGAIEGFEMEARDWRPTFKLSQNKTDAQRAGVIAGLEASGATAMAAMMRGLA